MKRPFIALVMSAAFLFAMSALAANKVVVVPLMSSGDPWIRVYDDNDQFVGFAHSLPNFLWPYTTLISSNNYSAITIPVPPDGNVFYPMNQKVYLTPGCSGSSYINQLPFVLHKIGLGVVFDISVSSSDYSTWYFQYGTSPVTVLPGNTYYTKSWDTSCTPVLNGSTELNLLETHPNDYNITGFRESSFYKGPFNYQYNLPKSP